VNNKPAAGSSPPTFHRSISCDSNLFNNKTGFTQSTIPPPVAQVAPLRGGGGGYNGSLGSHDSLLDEKVLIGVDESDVDVVGGGGGPFLLLPSSSSCSPSSSSQSLTYDGSSPEPHHHHHHQQQQQQLASLAESSSTAAGGQGQGQSHTINPSVLPTTKSPISSLPSVMVSPLQHHHHQQQQHNIRQENNKENIPLPVQDKESSTDSSSSISSQKSEVSLRVNCCTSDASSQTEQKPEDEVVPTANHLLEERCLFPGESHARSNSTPSLENGTRSSSSASSSSSHNSGSGGGSGSSSSSSSSSSFDDSSSSNHANTNSKGTSTGTSTSITNNHSSSIVPSYTGRQKTQEELECEELSRHLIKHLPQGDKLQQILGKQPKHSKSGSATLIHI
jgi:hypothetical protein